MSFTVIFGDRAPIKIDGAAEGDSLWIDGDDLEPTSGWELNPEGICKGDICVPIPPGRSADFSRDGGKRFNLAALGTLLEQPLVRDDKNRVWYFGEAASTRRNTMASLEAPDFKLPDLDGRMHRLSDYRGKKVLLSAWASW
jgi:hypothetical protein